MQTRSQTRDSSRLSANERREAIIEAVKEVFAKNGFDRTTSRDLAKAARVSEALLYKYFPTKLSLYQAMLRACAEAQIWSDTESLKAVQPSTVVLITMVESLIRQVIEGRSLYFDDAVGRLTIRSLLEDGGFARTILKPFMNTWIATFERCLKQAAATGDLAEFPRTPHVRAWLVHHVAFGLMLHVCSETPVDYDVPRPTLIQEAVRFALRGIGLKEDPINRHYDSRATCGVGK
jgi:AcrR family transcriptional regulator